MKTFLGRSGISKMNGLTVSIVAMLVAILSFTLKAHATSITYEISGVASGQIGATTFTNAEVDLIASGDTANATSFTTSGSTIFVNPFSDFTVTIAGIGTATITDPSEIWAVPAGSLTSIPAVVMGRIDQAHVNSITGIGLVGSNTLAGYEDTSAIGPITNEGGIGFEVGCGTPLHDPCLATTLGLLSFTSNISFPETTQATFTATVPEPSSLLLLGTGLLGLAGAAKRKFFS